MPVPAKWVVAGATAAIGAVVGTAIGLASLFSDSSEPSTPIPVAASPQRGRTHIKRTVSFGRSETASPVKRDTASPDGCGTDGDTDDGYGTDYSTSGYSTGYNTAGSVGSDEEVAKERSIVLRNGSSFMVKFFVLREDHMTTKSIKKKVSNKISAFLNGSITGITGVALGGKRSSEKTTVQENDPKFLLHDHRVLPSPRPGIKYRVGTTIKYPKGCRNLRVFGYFKDEDQQWKRYKNKVYRVGKRKTSHVITAMDHQILGHL